MHHHVGVAADRRRKVRVVVEREPIVPHILGAVHGFGHGPHRKRFQHVGLGRTLDLAQQVVDGAPHVAGAVDLHGVAERTHKLAEGNKFFGVGLVVDAVNHGPRGLLGAGVGLFSAGEHRHFAVGEQHEFFDELVGVLGLFHVSPNGLVLGVEAELDFGAVKRDGAVLHALGAEGLGHAVHEAQLRSERVVVALEHGLGLFVGKAAVGMDDRAPKPSVVNAPGLVHGKNGREREFVFARAQRANLVRQDFGQHRHHAVDQVD